MNSDLVVGMTGLVSVILAFVAGNIARRKHRNPWPWQLATFFVWIVALPVLLLLGPGTWQAPPPKSAAVVASDDALLMRAGWVIVAATILVVLLLLVWLAST